jgi:hypothetical protein
VVFVDVLLEKPDSIKDHLFVFLAGLEQAGNLHSEKEESESTDDESDSDDELEHFYSS